MKLLSNIFPVDIFKSIALTILSLAIILSSCSTPEKKKEDIVNVETEVKPKEIILPYPIKLEVLEKDSGYYMGEHNVDRITAVYNDSVPLFNTNSFDSDTLLILPRATLVKIIEKINEDSISNIHDYWYKVLQNDKVGYIWGHDLALARVKFDNESYLMFGLTSIDENNFHHGELTLIKKDSVIQKLAITPIQTSEGYITSFMYNLSMSIVRNRGLSGIDKMIYLTSSYDACGYPFGDLIVFWDGTKFIEGLAEEGMADADVFYTYPYLLFPNDSVGLHDKIVVKRFTGESSENSEVMDEKVELMVYNWDSQNKILTKQ